MATDIQSSRKLRGRPVQATVEVLGTEEAITERNQPPRKLRGRPGQATVEVLVVEEEEASVTPSQQRKKKASVLDDDFSLSPVEVRSKGDHTPRQEDRPAPRQTRRAAATLVAPRQEAEDPLQGKSPAGITQPSLDQSVGKGRAKASLNWSMQRKSRAAPPTGRSRMECDPEESAPQSIDSSIFAPNSLTPSVGGGAGEGSNKVDISLPSSGMMTEIFRKKTKSTKKKFFLDESDSEEEKESEGPASKKQRIDADVATPPRPPSLGGPGESQGPPKSLEAPGESQRPSNLGQRSQADVFGGLRGKGNRRKVDDDKSVSRVSASPLKRKRDDSDDVGGGHHLEASGPAHRTKGGVQQQSDDGDDVIIVGESLSQRDNLPGTARKKKKLSKPVSAAGKTSSIPAISLESLDPVLDISREVPTPLGDSVTDVALTSRTLHDQSVTTIQTSSTSFLSTRKRRKKAGSREPNTQRSPTPSGPNSTFTAGSEFSQRSFTSLTLNKHKEDIPLTAISMGGRRSKATPITAADALWMKEERSEVVGGGGSWRMRTLWREDMGDMSRAGITSLS